MSMKKCRNLFNKINYTSFFEILGLNKKYFSKNEKFY